MSKSLMRLSDMARYLGISPAVLIRAICNRGTLEKVPLPSAIDEELPLSSRCWSPQEVRQFRHQLQRQRHQHK